MVFLNRNLLRLAESLTARNDRDLLNLSDTGEPPVDLSQPGFRFYLGKRTVKARTIDLPLEIAAVTFFSTLVVYIQEAALIVTGALPTDYCSRIVANAAHRFAVPRKQ